MLRHRETARISPRRVAFGAQFLAQCATIWYVRFMESKSSLGSYVRSLRREKRWSLQTLSELVDLSPSRMSRIETDSAIPTADTVVKLAKALDGDLDLMLEMAHCLPQEILERLVRRVGGSADPHRRLAGKENDDPTFAAALVEDIDPEFRLALAKAYQLPDKDVDGIFSVLQRLARMDSVERNAVIGFLTSDRGDSG